MWSEWVSRSVFEFDLLEDHLRDVWSILHEEVCKNEVCEELKGVSASPTNPGPHEAYGVLTSNPALSKTRSTLASFKVLT